MKYATGGFRLSRIITHPGCKLGTSSILSLCNVQPPNHRSNLRYSVLAQASSNAASRPAGFLTFTLHAHLPYVVNHGTWPHGMEWLHEAAAETYLPLLRMLKNLERDNIRFN